MTMTHKHTKIYYFYIFLFLNIILISCKKNNLPIEDLYTTVELKEGVFPDFSYAGYKRSEVPIPYYPVVKTLEAIDGDNYQRIQNAINEIGNRPLMNGIRGALLLKAGVYNISRELIISKNGVVLRGEGQGENGTRLIATRKFYTTTPSVLAENALVSIRGSKALPILSGPLLKITNDIKVGEKRISLENTNSLSIGDTIVVRRTPNEDWIDFIGMRQHGWTPDHYTIQHQRVVKNIIDNNIEIDIPMVDNIIQKYGGGSVSLAQYTGRVEDSGIENIRMSSIFEHDEDENHTWSAIFLRQTRNCWVRNVTAERFSFACVSMLHADYNTVQDCAMIKFASRPWGERRYSFHINFNSTGNLFQRCYSDGGRHDFATSARVAGPNVFLDGLAINTLADSGPHHRWATGTLYDNISAGMLYARNAGGGGTGHGWAGAQQMFWNSNATKGFLVQSPPGAQNWLIGATGEIYTQTQTYQKSSGIRVLPRSLFFEQLKKRLGEDAIIQITHPAQRQNTPIWDLLEQWKGSEDALVKLTVPN